MAAQAQTILAGHDGRDVFIKLYTGYIPKNDSTSPVQNIELSMEKIYDPFTVQTGRFCCFKDSDIKKKDLRFGYRRAQGIQLEFLYDAWYCTSSSAKYNHLTGRRVATVFAIIRELTEDSENDILKIRCSALAIGSCFNPIYSGRFFTDEFSCEGEEDDCF